MVRVVQVRVVQMPVTYRFVAVPMRMRFAHRTVVGMLVVVVHMSVFVGRVVEVLVLVPFGKVQPEADRHQQACGGRLQGERIAEHDLRHKGADKGGQREIGPSPRRPQAPESQHEHHKA